MPKRKILISIFSILVLLTFCVPIFIRQAYVVPILMYHSVKPDAPPQDRLIVSVSTFERQMRFLRKNRYNVIPLQQLAELIKEKRRIPPRTVSITLDDGYKDNYVYAYPILKRYNIIATIFLIVNEVGRPDRLSWDEIAEMQDSGIVFFGSHTLGPEPLTNIKSDTQLKSEIFDSKQILQEKLKVKVGAFSYPEGRFNAKIRQMVIDAGYSVAVTTNPGRGYPNDDIFALKRIRISETSRNTLVFWLQTSGLYTFIKEHRRK